MTSNEHDEDDDQAPPVDAAVATRAPCAAPAVRERV